MKSFKSLIIALLTIAVVTGTIAGDLTVKTTKTDSLFVQIVIYDKQQIFTLINSQGIVSFALIHKGLTCDFSKLQGSSNQLVKIFKGEKYKFLTCFLIKNDKIVELSSQDIAFLRAFISNRMKKGEFLTKLVNNGDLEKLAEVAEGIAKENKMYRQKIKLLLK